MTNLEKIKLMDSKQMASFLFLDICSKCTKPSECKNNTIFDCLASVREWLEQEAEHDR